MLSRKQYFFVAIASLMVSCHNNKVLFTDVPEKLYVEIPEAVIQVGDILDVNITSLNSQSTSIFSPTSLGKIGTIRNLEARKLDPTNLDILHTHGAFLNKTAPHESLAIFNEMITLSNGNLDMEANACISKVSLLLNGNLHYYPSDPNNY